MKPRLLDLFSGAGGAGMGYRRAGFDVVGVDLAPQPHYPFEFHQADALDVLESWRDGGHWFYAIGDVDAIHASPPCQAHTALSARWRGQGGRADSHVDLIAETRDLLDSVGLPYVIENVMGASRSLEGRVVRVCGASVGLRQSRHRLFECGGWMCVVPPCSCNGREFKSVLGVKPDGRWLRKKADGTRANFVVSSVEEGRELMGIDWMDWRELCEAIPPAYTELIGSQLLSHVITEAA